MSITTELREFVDGLACHKVTRDMLCAIADRIDQEHEECAGFCRRLEDAASKGEEVTIFGTDYIPLPKDADGVPIRVGDNVEWVDEPDVARVVSSIYLAGDGWWVYVGGTGRRPDKHRHHHEPTVEDVLRDVVTLCHNTWKEESPFHFYDVDDVMKSGNIADFAAKLRLAGEDA